MYLETAEKGSVMGVFGSWVKAAFVLGAMSATAAQAGVIRHDRLDSQYLNLGSKFANVGRIITSTPGGNYLGSGTLIGSQWVLTAGHVVDDVTAATVTFGSTAYKASAWYSHPNWTGNVSTGYDIGLFRLSAPVSGITPAQRYYGTSELGKAATIVGYGRTGTGLTGATRTDQKKRAGTNRVDTTTASGRVLLTDFDNPQRSADSAFGSSLPLDLEYMIAPGDSGGALFIDVTVNNLMRKYLAGVTSYGTARDGIINSDYGDIGGFMRVSSLNGWIDAVLAGRLTSGAGAGTQSAFLRMADEVAVPEPGMIGLFGLGALGVFAARRRRTI